MQQLPLCVDCDGTLISTDLLFEGLLQIVKQDPWCLFLIPYWLLAKGKAHLKMQVAARSSIAAESLPYNAEFVEYLREQHAQGRSISLVTGSPAPFASAIANYIGLFAEVHATTESCNLTSSRKRDFLCAHFGESRFEYAGNEAADLPIWRSAGAAIAVNTPASVIRAIPSTVPVTRVFQRGRTSFGTYLRALRVHQWLKNLLIFVPMAVSHRVLDPGVELSAIFAFIAFSLCASAVYILNDLLDLRSDRLHPRKRFRPFAAGLLSVPQGVAMAAGCVAIAIAVSTQLPPLFWATLAGYMVVTTAYSFALKNRAIVDVLLLASLYTVRIIAGSAATGIRPSFWLLAFAMFLFLSLAVVKRYAELLVMVGDGKQSIHGRGYVAADLPLLITLGVGNGLLAVLVLALYVNSPEVSQLYRSKETLWLMPPLMLFWVCRVWLKTHRGEMHDDPIVFAASDRTSLLVGACLGGILLLATMIKP